MKRLNNLIIVGIDHGYGNIKTASRIFPSGILEANENQYFGEKPLIFENKTYLIGEGHKDFLADKFMDNDYYILTLAAIAEELLPHGITNANIYIAAGLPLTWLATQSKEFKEYLLKNRTLRFNYKGKDYNINIIAVEIFPQGFSAIANRINMFKGTNMLCDIGNGTMNIMYINNQKPDIKGCFTEKFGTNQCAIRIKEKIMQVYHTAIPESTINEVLRFGKADISDKYLSLIIDVAKDYAEEIFQRLRTHEYNPEIMKLHIVGGGGCLVKNFGSYDKNRVIICDDINATAKGYEYLAELHIRKGGKKR